MARFLSAPPSFICGFLSSSWPSFAAAIRRSWGHLKKRKKSYVKGIWGPRKVSGWSMLQLGTPS